jgi:hypothetical protein
MFGRHSLFLFVLLLSVGCASVGQNGASSYEAVGNTLHAAVTDYLAIQSRLTAAQREEFMEAYERVCKSYQTAGVLLTVAVDAQDAPSANTSIVAYQRTVNGLPALAAEVSRVVRKLKGTAK